MTLPFSSDQFFQVFANYNQAWLPVIVLFWVCAMAVLAAVWQQPDRSRWMTAYLAALWGWNALAYHAWFFARINPAAWLFAALFGVQAIALVVFASRNRLVYFKGAGARAVAGGALTLYALAYPVLTVLSGHVYPAAPTFAVPCPTDILTVGMLLTVRGRIPVPLAIVPALWGVVGGSAAIMLQVPTDLVLLATGLVLPVVVMVELIRAPRALAPTSGDLRTRGH